MKNLFIIFQCLLGIYVTSSSYAINESREGYDPSERNKGDPHFYSLIGKEDCELDVKILGSQHNVPNGYVQKIVRYQVSAADILIGETSPNDDWILGDFSHVSRETLELHRFLDIKHRNWLQELPYNQQEIIRKHIDPQIQKLWGVSSDEISPAIISYYLANSILGYQWSRQGGMDCAFEEEFLNAGKEVHGLEKGSDRFEASGELYKLAKEDRRVSLNYIRIFIDEWNKYREEDQTEFSTEKLETIKHNLSPQNFKEYLSGDTSYLKNKPRDISVQKRNLIWVPRMQEIINSNPGKFLVFMVGCGHLYGENGLIELLEKEGFKLVRIYKHGQNNPSLFSWCNYVVGKRYVDLIEEAAKTVLLKKPEKFNGGFDKIEEIQLQYEFFIEMLKKFASKSSAKAPISSLEYNKFYDLAQRVRKYEMQNCHTVLQIADGYYRPNILFSTDLEYAINGLLKRARSAKERF